MWTTVAEIVASFLLGGLAAIYLRQPVITELNTLVADLEGRLEALNAALASQSSKPKKAAGAAPMSTGG